MGELEGEAVIVTGAGQGLGAAYSRAVAAAGAPVVVNDINHAAAEAVAAEIRSAGGRAVADPADIRNPEKAQALVERCITEFGFVSGLVNNAGLCERAPFAEATVEDLQRMLEVNVVGVFNCARAVIEPMLRQGRGSIVNAISGAHSGQQGLTSYGATKGAVASFTYGWAGELRGKGIRVNAISPVAATPMAARTARTSAVLPPPAVNAPLVVYLLSNRASDITGQVVRLNAGRLSLMTHPANRAPVLVNESWTVQSIAEAFDQKLAALQLPTDIATYEIAEIVTNTSRAGGPV